VPWPLTQACTSPAPPHSPATPTQERDTREGHKRERERPVKGCGALG
jgi:hypothetical protein